MYGMHGQLGWATVKQYCCIGAGRILDSVQPFQLFLRNVLLECGNYGW